MIKTMIRTWRKGNVMKSFEEMVQDIVQEKLNSEVIEKVIEEKLQSAVSSACDNIFRWNGDGKKMIEDKLKEVFIPALLLLALLMLYTFCISHIYRYVFSFLSWNRISFKRAVRLLSAFC